MAPWLVVIALGAGLVLIGTAQGWVTEQTPLLAEDAGPTATSVLTGRELAPGAAPAAWAALAGLLVVIATRGAFRRVVGVAIALAGALAALTVLAASQPVPAAVAATAGGLLVAAGGAATVRFGRAWPALGRRYDAPGGIVEPASSPWEALDAGHDPTDPGLPPA